MNHAPHHAWCETPKPRSPWHGAWLTVLIGVLLQHWWVHRARQVRRVKSGPELFQATCFPAQRPQQDSSCPCLPPSCMPREAEVSRQAGGSWAPSSGRLGCQGTRSRTGMGVPPADRGWALLGEVRGLQGFSASCCGGTCMVVWGRSSAAYRPHVLLPDEQRPHASGRIQQVCEGHLETESGIRLLGPETQPALTSFLRPIP